MNLSEIDDNYLELAYEEVSQGEQRVRCRPK